MAVGWPQVPETLDFGFVPCKQLHQLPLLVHNTGDVQVRGSVWPPHHVPNKWLCIPVPVRTTTTTTTTKHHVRSLAHECHQHSTSSQLRCTARAPPTLAHLSQYPILTRCAATYMIAHLLPCTHKSLNCAPPHHTRVCVCAYATCSGACSLGPGGALQHCSRHVRTAPRRLRSLHRVLPAAACRLLHRSRSVHSA
jgi:hypothetical protein